MSFNIFGTADKNSIKVGYVDPERGYITGVSRLEANKYAALNPGVRFIVTNREKTRFLNINQVNELKPTDLIPKNNPSNADGCRRIDGLRPGDINPNDLPARICITGGSGIGAVGNPIFGTDGALLAVNLVRGGFGYRTPPRVKICDDTKQGSGAVMRALTGELAETEEVFDQEDDFEIYDLSGDTLPGYGDRFGPDGQNLGQWDPNLFASLAESPIGAEIQKYQDYLKQAIDAGGGVPYGGAGTAAKIECWWHTRKETPEVVVFRDKTTQIKHDVAHWAWGGDVTTKSVDGKSPPSKADNFVDLKFEVFTQGGNNADSQMQFVFTAEDGSHSFIFKAPDFKDSKKTTVTKKVKKNTKYKVSANGRFRGKGVEQGLIAGIGKNAKEIKGNKKGSVIFADFVKSSNDNDDLQVRATQGTFNATGERKTTDGHSTNDLSYIFKDNSSFKPPKEKKIKVYDVKDSFMNRFAVSPVPPSDIPGTDYAGQWCTFEWEENFPYTGEYTFRGMADNISKVYLDNELIMEPKNFKGNPLPKDTKKVTIQAGIHRIKIDLFNIPIREKPKPKPGSEGCPTEIDFKVTTSAKFGNGIKIPGLSVNVSKSYDGKQLNESFRRKVELGKEYEVICTSSKGGGGNKGYQIDYDGLNSANNPIDVSGSGKTIKLKDGDGNDTNASFRIMSDSPGVGARFSSDGRSLNVNKSGDVTLRLEWNDNPNTAGVAVKSISVGGKTWRQSSRKGDQTETIKVSGGGGGGSGDIRLRTAGANVLQMEEHTDKDWQDLVCTVSCGRFIKISGNRCKLIFDAPPDSKQGSKGSQSRETIFNTADYINKADRKLWRTNVYGRGGFLNNYGVCPFNTRKPLADNPYAGRHVIRWEHINFPADGNYDIEVDADDSVKLFIGNRTGNGAMAIGNGLKDIDKGGDEVIIENGMKKTTYTRFFKKGKYRIRAELTQIPGGRFSFDRKSKPKVSSADVKFVRRGGETYMKVNGSGSVDISFRLRTDDNPRSSGVFANKIRIGKGPNDSIELKRTRTGVGGRGGSKGRLKEKEVITGTASFEAGREYLVNAVGSSSGTGSIIKNNGRTIEYDDNIGNGFDENADLTITKIKGTQAAPVKGVNPMALAIDIKSRVKEQGRISAKSWNQNPMGAALCIDAPLPPIPKEPPVEGEGRCPKNPIWTTRFPGSSESWWPVTLDARWSKFMNRFALSPLPPRREKNTDGGGGKVYSTTWDFEAPYDGFYALKGTCDNWGRVLVNNGDTYTYKLRGFKTVSPPVEKFFLPQGNHKITVEVENQKTLKKKTTKKKVFTTKDWAKSRTGGGSVDVDFKVTSSAKFANSVEMKGVFSFGKSYDGPQIKESASKKLESGKVYNVVFTSNRKGGSSNKGYQIDYDGLNSANDSINSSSKELKFKDGDGSDANAKFKIMSSSPGVDVKFSSDGRSLDVKGNGDVTLRLEWNDNPNTAGVALKSISLGGKTWRQSGRSGDQTETIKVSGGSSGSQGNNSAIKLRNAGENVVQMEDHKDNDWQDIVVSASKGKFYDFNGNKAKFVVGFSKQQQTTKTQDGVTYTGPELFRGSNKNWSEFMNNINVSPYLPPLNVDNPDLPGDRTFTFSNVNFFDSGSQEIKFQSDDNATLFINGNKVAESKSFRGTPNITRVDLSAGRYEIKVVVNNLRFRKNAFTNNPTGFALDIRKEVILFRESKPWLVNPVGVSAILIPPPCPKKVRGVGIVTDIIVDEPGNYPPQPPPPGSGYPVVLQLTDIVPTDTGSGINYGPDDVVCVENEDGTKICFPIGLGNFGQVNEVKVSGPPGSPPSIIIPPVYPTITLESDTGIGFVGRPVIRPVIVPENILPPEDIIQVTDLVGLKKTGYVNGKPYYGSVFSRDGQLFAGIYETIGELIPVYATLQESIDNQITTRPSAILRQGTNVTSNDPRLNIPRTPENLI